jgi:hypothetical protein
VTLLLTAGCLSQNPDAGLEQGLQLLEESRTTLAENALANARDHFTKLTQQPPDNAVHFYELARGERLSLRGLCSACEKKKALLCVTFVTAPDRLLCTFEGHCYIPCRTHDPT